MKIRFARRQFLSGAGLAQRFLRRSRHAAAVVEPAHLAIDLTRGWHGRTIRDPLPLAAWEDIALQVTAWLGPLPVTVLVRSDSLHPDTAAIVRFIHRLGCPVSLWGQAGGIGEEQALALLDAGLQRAQVVVGGVRPGTFVEAVGGDLPQATSAVLALLEARDARRASTRIWMEFPCLPNSVSELAAVEGWARQVGVDGFLVTAPLRAPVAPSNLEPAMRRAIQAMERRHDVFLRTPPGTAQAVENVWLAGDGQPGASGTAGRCPVAGQRLDLRADGNFGACPYKNAAGCYTAGASIRQMWTVAQAHREAIQRCTRVCFHPELISPVLWFR